MCVMDSCWNVAVLRTGAFLRQNVQMHSMTQAVRLLVNNVWPVLLALGLSACAVSPEVRQAADHIAGTAPSSVLTCPRARPDRCAQPSDLMSLAEDAADNRRHYLRLMEYGDESLLARLHLIRSARSSIDIQAYIFRADSSARWLLDELQAAARRGVRVRLLLDQFGASGDFLYLMDQALTHQNLSIAFYNPIWNEFKTSFGDMLGNLACCFRNFNRRMHNKLFVVDDRIAIIGGRNIADAYFDLDPDYTFVDRGALVVGPVVSEMAGSFLHYWKSDISVPLHQLDDVAEYLAEKGVPDLPGWQVEPRLQDLVERLQARETLEERLMQHLHAAADIQYFADHPGKPGPHDQPAWEDITTAIHDVIVSAESSVLIQSPYLIMSDLGRETFRKLVRKNPDMRVRVSTNSLAATDNIPTYAYLHKKKRLWVKDLGFEVFEFQPYPADRAEFVPRHELLVRDQENGYHSVPPEDRAPNPTRPQPGPRLALHGKSFVIDGDIAMIGSHNFDPRSEDFNTEAGLIIRDAVIAKELERNILKAMDPDNAWVLAPKPRVPLLSAVNGVVESLSSSLPTLDLWPFKRVHAYELKTGFQPVPMDHPDFYKRYELRGRYPEVTLPTFKLQTSLFSAFFGFLAPIL